MKVIFLDIDGVLCSMRSSAAQGGYPAAGNPASWGKFDDTAVELLRTAIAETGAVVVLSSSWRTEVNIGALEYRLGLRIRDVTRASNEDDMRGKQIGDWLATHDDVQRYAILDDGEDMLPHQMDKLCRTSKRNGFLLGHYEELVEMLGSRVDTQA